MCVGRAEAVKRGTARQTCDGAEQTLKCLGHVVREEVFVNLHQRDDRLLGVGKLCFTADTEQLLALFDLLVIPRPQLPHNRVGGGWSTPVPGEGNAGTVKHRAHLLDSGPNL